MALLPPIKRFVQDDFNGIKEVAAFAGKLFYPLNLFLNAVYAALNNGLTLAQNTIGVVSVQGNITSNANGVATTTINWPFLQTPPKGVVVMSCTISTVGTYAPLISWSYSSGVVSISMQFVTASGGSMVVAAPNTYAVSFWVSAG